MKIEVKHLTKEFNEKEVLKDINMSFYSGNIYCLSGPNGSGKSVFLKLLRGVENPSKGEILVDGENIYLNSIFSYNIKSMLDKLFFFDRLTGYENLKLSALLKKDITDDDILIALKKVGLLDAKDNKYSEYSFGMKRRLMIAKVLMEDSKIIVLDEPFTGVDQDVKENLINILKMAKAKNRLIIISTNNDSTVKNLADVTYYFSNGKLFWI